MDDRGQLLIRPIKINDFDAILKIAKEVGGGFTSLPEDPSLIKKKIEASVLSFQTQIPEEDRFYFFVLEDLTTKRIVGTSALQSSRARPSMYYVYEQDKPNGTSGILRLKQKYNKSTVFCTLFAYHDQKKTQKGRGKFASRSRCLFIAEFPHLLSGDFIAELRGVLDKNGESPFWDAVGKKVFNINFTEANFKVARLGTAVIVNEMPKSVEISSLPKEAVEVLGQPNPDTAPAHHILQMEGFTQQQDFDLVDAGPIMTVSRENLRSASASRKLKISKLVENIENKTNNYMMIANPKLENYKVTLGYIEIDNEQIILENKIAQILDLKISEYCRFAPFY